MLNIAGFVPTSEVHTTVMLILSIASTDMVLHHVTKNPPNG